MGRLIKGFTLLETLIAITILGIVLSVIFSLFSESFGRLEKLEKDIKDFTGLQKAIFLGNTQGVDIKETTLKEYNVKVRIYRRGNIELIEVE